MFGTPGNLHPVQTTRVSYDLFNILLDPKSAWPHVGTVGRDGYSLCSHAGKESRPPKDKTREKSPTKDKRDKTRQDKYFSSLLHNKTVSAWLMILDVP